MSSGGTDASASQALGEMIATEMAAMNESTRTFEASMAQNQKKAQEIYDTIFAAQNKKKDPPLSPEIQRIVAIMQQYPALVDPVSRFITKKIEAISAAMAAILNPPEESP